MFPENIKNKDVSQVEHGLFNFKLMQLNTCNPVN
jgi:hypothetical protein